MQRIRNAILIPSYFSRTWRVMSFVYNVLKGWENEFSHSKVDTGPFTWHLLVDCHHESLRHNLTFGYYFLGSRAAGMYCTWACVTNWMYIVKSSVSDLIGYCIFCLGDYAFYGSHGLMLVSTHISMYIYIQMGWSPAVWARGSRLNLPFPKWAGPTLGLNVRNINKELLRRLNCFGLPDLRERRTRLISFASWLCWDLLLGGSPALEIRIPVCYKFPLIMFIFHPSHRF